MRQVFARWLDQFAPRHLAPRGATQLLQERLLVALLIGAALANTSLAIYLHLQQQTLLVATTSIGAGLCGALLLVLRLKATADNVAIGTGLVFSLQCAAWLILLGGPAATPALIWLVCAPWLARQLLPRQGLPLLVLSALILIGLAALAQQWGVLPPPLLEGAALSELNLLCAMLALALGTLMAGVEQHLGAAVVGAGRLDARRDPLTGLLNADAFAEAVRNWTGAAGAPCQSAALLVCDIDHLQPLNRQFGRRFGDQLLRATAHCLRRQLRDQDPCARLGGDRFAVWLHDTPEGPAARIAERIREQIARQSIANPAQTLSNLTISGALIQLRPSSGIKLNECLARAAELLDEAKQGGRDQIIKLDLRPAGGQRKAA